MSQRAVERMLGRLITDEGFRDQFFKNPGVACFSLGAELSQEELEALSRVPPSALAELSTRIDDRICRLHIALRPNPEE